MVLLSLTFASLTIPACSYLSSASFLHCLTPIFLKPFTSSSHLSLGLPMLRFPSGLVSRIFCGTLLLSILRTCPSNSVHLDLISVTKSALLYRLSSFFDNVSSMEAKSKWISDKLVVLLNCTLIAHIQVFIL
jgi:hypothetical protein